MKHLALIVAACAVAAACSPPAETAAEQTTSPVPATDMQHGDMGAAGMMAPAAGDSEATRGYKGAMMAMMSDAPAYSGNADADFMTQMRVHHQAAIAMARVELAEGANPEAKALAREIIAAQEREIGVIDAWLTANRDGSRSASPDLSEG